MDRSISLVVNAGGQSRRMGREKALLSLPPNGVPLVVHVIRRLTPLVSDHVVVVTNESTVATAVNALENVQVVADRWANGGALGGIATGLALCAGWAMVVACDMPLVDPAIFAQLLDVTRTNPELDAVIPRIAGQAHPFHGMWHRRALPRLEASLAAGELGVQRALASLNVAWPDEGALRIEADDLAFYNVNTPQDWETLLAILAKQNRPIA